MKKLIVITGPTSSGKTSLALRLCRENGGEIVSADSRQVYKHMDVGTGKLPINKSVSVEKLQDKWVLDGVSVWGYDLVEPDEYFSSYEYGMFALKKVHELFTLYDTVYLVGGTGFYIDTVLGNTRPSGTPPDFSYREELERYSLEKLQNELKTNDKKAYEKIDINNRVRVIRALEKSRKPEETSLPLPYLENVEKFIIGLKADREIFYERADLWLEKIWDGDLLKEVRFLLNSKYKNSEKLNGLVYKTVNQYFVDEIAEEDAKQRIKYDLHAYIRRQQTYFKKMKNVRWVDVSKDNFYQKVYNIANG